MFMFIALKVQFGFFRFFSSSGFYSSPPPHMEIIFTTSLFFFFFWREPLWWACHDPFLHAKTKPKVDAFFYTRTWSQVCCHFGFLTGTGTYGNSQFLGSHTSLFLPLCKGFWNLLHDYEICCCFSAKLSKQQINWLLSLGLYHHNRSSFVLCCELACRWWWQCVQLRWCMETTDTSWLHQLVPSAELPQVRACLSPLEPPGLCEEPCVQPSCSVCCDMSPQLRDRWTD